MTYYFFGHRDFPREMMPNLRAQIVHLIENRGVTQFYVGNQGYFDYAVLQILRSCRQIYPQISYSVVLAYMPQQELPGIEDTETLLPGSRWSLHRAAMRFAAAITLDAGACRLRGDLYPACIRRRYAALAARQGKEILPL